VPSTAFRGFGNPQQIWAVESNMDEAARRLGIDPLALRLRNLARPGESFIPGDTPADGDWRASVERAAELIGWGAARSRAVAAASPWGSRRARRPGSRTRPFACSRTAAWSCTRAHRTWARARARSSPRSPRRSSARRWTGSPSSWAIRPWCRTTSRPRPVDRPS
jgi:CO/xanthine dehydrogenase Mo-binding subunit